MKGTPYARCAPLEKGVGIELARERKASVRDVSYNLTLSIDSDPYVSPCGHIGIEFGFTPSGSDLQIDFAGKEVRGVIVNGKHLDSPVWTDDHIVIPDFTLTDGQNRVEVDFVSADRALNRNPDYMYSLFVPHRAHSVFPCFDQPDVKASYSLSLTIPCEWQAVSNSPIIEAFEDSEYNRRVVNFSPTEPLSTYLFAFAAGDFSYREHKTDSRTIGAYYRETDPERLAQLDEIFRQVDESLRYLEEYTGVPYPFAKYDLVILPGFQFGGMEHTGATFYNDNVLFLGKSATAEDRLRRAQVIAHETAHMWFGDYVTMEWFDDVWTKEVLANYFAAMMVREMLPEFDHDLEWLRVYMSAALEQDRSEGTTSIRQSLSNLKDAGLIYNNIIYNKSPIMLGKMVERVGIEAFRDGIKRYLADHPYGNASWDDLVDAIDFYGGAGLESFSRVWVYEYGMPRLDVSFREGMLTVGQSDAHGRGLVWPQEFDVLVVGENVADTVTVKFDGTKDTVSVPVSVVSGTPLILPSADGRAYGLIVPPAETLRILLSDFSTWHETESLLKPVGSLSTLMMLNENYLAGHISPARWLECLLSLFKSSSDPQWLSAVIRYVAPAFLDIPDDEAAGFEERFLEAAMSHPVPAAGTLMIRGLIPALRSNQSAEILLGIWENGPDECHDEDMLTDMALVMAIILPGRSEEILSTQRARISDSERLRKFDFISRAACSDIATLDSLFLSLSDPEARKVEPWTRTFLSLLNHPARQQRSVRYIQPALNLLPEIQTTGDIFFPTGWSSSLLSGYSIPQAAAEVEEYLSSHSNLNPLLLGKVREAAARLRFRHRLSQGEMHFMVR